MQEHRVLSYETTTLWPLVTTGCIITAFVFSKGKPFRKPVYTNCKWCAPLPRPFSPRLAWGFGH